MAMMQGDPGEEPRAAVCTLDGDSDHLSNSSSLVLQSGSDRGRPHTVHECLRQAFSKYQDGPAIGRLVSGAPPAQALACEYVTYGELAAMVFAVADALLNRLPAAGLRDGGTATPHVGLFAENRLEWLVTAIACPFASAVFVPIFHQASQGVTEKVIACSDLHAVLCSASTLPLYLDAIKTTPPPHLILTPDARQIWDALPSRPAGLTAHDWDVLARSGPQAPPPNPAPPTPDSVLTIIYTGGTSGDPKGAVLSHRNVLSAVASVDAYLSVSRSDVYLSYLPLAHTYELVCIFAGLVRGASACVWRNDISTLVEDLRVVRPTIFTGVPRVLTRIVAHMDATVRAQPWPLRLVFRTLFAAKRLGVSPPFADAAFAPFRQALGGRVRLIVCGSAPLSPAVQQYLRVVTGAAVVQGYGLTETTALTTIQHPRDRATCGNVGVSFPCVEIKLADLPELGYVGHRGEVCVRGPAVFAGYYRDAEQTARAIDGDGWFHTGDVGTWTADGHLQIIDRAKNVIKLAQGEYVPVEAIEAALVCAEHVQNIFLHAELVAEYLVGVVVVTPEGHRAIADAAGQADGGKCRIYQSIRDIARAHQIAGFCVPKQLHLEHEPWTVEGGLLTPTLKLRREAIRHKYAAQLKRLYELPRLDRGTT